MKTPSRRVVLTGLVGATALSLTVFSIAGPAVGETLSPAQAFDAARDGDILLVDIRRPDEWERTGVPKGAVPIDMRRDDFIDAVLAARQSQAQPIALICARGVRSARVTRHLTDAGLTPIIDIPEGMLGSFAGSGWLKRGLPVLEWSKNN
ncbi:MAG: rhodanese-like domain-containing protein [Pseudoruegeria sp.]